MLSQINRNYCESRRKAAAKHILTTVIFYESFVTVPVIYGKVSLEPNIYSYFDTANGDGFFLFFLILLPLPTCRILFGCSHFPFAC